MTGRGRALRDGRAGFTLLELLIVLGLISLMAAIALPSVAVQIDQAQAHSQYLKFQQQVLDLRRQSFHQAEGLRLVSTGEFNDDPQIDPPLAQAQLDQGWSYRLSVPVDIDSGGRCTAADVDILHGDRVRLHLVGQGPSCRFLRALR